MILNRMRLIKAMIWSSFLMFCIFGKSVQAQTTYVKEHRNPIHMDLEASGEEYLNRLQYDVNLLDSDQRGPFDAILTLGKRNILWVEKINSVRPENLHILLSSAETQVGYPINAPTVNNESLILQDFAKWKNGLPVEVSQVYFGVEDLPTTVSIEDSKFVVIARAIDRLYQRSSRWLLQQPYLEYYKEESKSDLRGYYHLLQEKDLGAKLDNFDAQTDSDRERLRKHLLGQCFNSIVMSRESCAKELAKAETSKMVREFYGRFMVVSEMQYRDFFKIPNYRSDVTWTSANENLMSVPFTNPRVDNVLNWLRDNIEDEWKWDGWQLKLNFIDSSSPNTTHIEFVEGATPHVNGIAGSIITMDGNRNLYEYNSKWTIRHEYGHVLGFPDCYLEFFDESLNAMISYQLDITNLMCSRRG
ncbi:MAG: hypothetical protein NT027_15525, partial [Proteobacteria bacterium]|nr:hypothetical protein [Pseudomonadota bacterium]